MSTSTLLVIDGNSIANRAFFGIRPLSNKAGIYTHSITGFMNILLKLRRVHAPENIAVAFDMRAPTFRTALYDGYKANRKGMPEELAIQMPYIKDILRMMGVAFLEYPGYDAEDLIGILSRLAAKAGGSSVLATGDRDAFQLVTDSTFVSYARTGEDILYDPEKIREQYGLLPEQLIEVKALMGDASDNIPGVAGIGEKTALALIQQYNNLDYIYDNLSSLPIKENVRAKLTAGKDSAFLSRNLGRIITDAPELPLTPETCKQRPADEAGLYNLLSELEMSALIKKLDLTPAADAPAAKTADASASLSHISHAVFSEKTLFTSGGELRGDGINAYLQNGFEKSLFDTKTLLEAGFEINMNSVIFDTVLSAYLLNVNANGYTLDRLCSEYGVSFDANDAASSLRQLNALLYDKLVSEDMLKVLRDIELPLAKVLADMERAGIAVNLAGIVSFGEELARGIESAAREIYALAGQEFNILSPKQLGNILFNVLCLPTGKKSKTGFSTNSDVLESLYEKHEIIPLIIEYRAASKLKSTYVDGLLAAADGSGVIHTTYKQTETRTGRISSAEPNLQNIPVRTERGRRMRGFFTAREGFTLIDADYSQIELRVLAHISGDKNMIDAFLSGKDIHTITASQVFNQPEEWVTPEMRRRAKAVNFGIVYGIGAFSLGKDIGVSTAEAARYIDNYLAHYSEVGAFMKRVVADAKRDGYVTTMFGRRRYIKDISSPNKNIAAGAERMAMNTPIQGTAADIIKIAMVRAESRLRKENLASRLVLQIHDELIVEAPLSESEQASAILREEMENAAQLSVPLVVDLNVGKDWLEAHG